MEAKSSKSEKPEPLPANGSDFWKNAENEKCKVGPNRVCDRALHEFEMVNGREVKCVRCPLGYVLSVGADIRKKHIYFHGEFVI
jgi:hypothetical protein